MIFFFYLLTIGSLKFNVDIRPIKGFKMQIKELRFVFAYCILEVLFSNDIDQADHLTDILLNDNTMQADYDVFIQIHNIMNKKLESLFNSEVYNIYNLYYINTISNYINENDTEFRNLLQNHMQNMFKITENQVKKVILIYLELVVYKIIYKVNFIIFFVVKVYGIVLGNYFNINEDLNKRTNLSYNETSQYSQEFTKKISESYYHRFIYTKKNNKQNEIMFNNEYKKEKQNCKNIFFYNNICNIYMIKILVCTSSFFGKTRDAVKEQQDTFQTLNKFSKEDFFALTQELILKTYDEVVKDIEKDNKEFEKFINTSDVFFIYRAQKEAEEKIIDFIFSFIFLYNYDFKSMFIENSLSNIDIYYKKITKYLFKLKKKNEKSNIFIYKTE